MSCVPAGSQCVSISESSLWPWFYAPAHHLFIYLSLLVLMSAWTLHEMESVHLSYASHKCHFFLHCFETPCILLPSVCVCAVILFLSTCAVADFLSARPETVSADLRWIQHRGSLRTKTAFMASELRDLELVCVSVCVCVVVRGLNAWMDLMSWISLSAVALIFHNLHSLLDYCYLD